MLRPCVWSRCRQPVLLLWGQHPHPVHVPMGRNSPSISTLAASQPRVQPPAPRLGLRGAVRHSGVLLSPCSLPWSCFKSWEQPGLCWDHITQLLGVPGEGRKVAFNASRPLLCHAVGSGRLQAGSCPGAARLKHLPVQGRSAFAESWSHPYAAVGALPEAGRHHPARSSLHFLLACLHIASRLLLAGNLHSPRSCLVAPNVALIFPAPKGN